MDDKWRFLIWGLLLGNAIAFAGGQLLLGRKYDTFVEQEQLESANIALVQDVMGNVASPDPAFWNSVLADDLNYWMIGDTPFSGRRQGKEDFLALYGEVAGHLDGMIPLEIDKIRASGDWVFVEMHGEARAKNGKPYANTYLQVIRVKNRKITDFTEYLDTKLIMDTFFSEEQAE